jgi:hypothetical protein
MPDQICFPFHQGVPFQPGPPAVDGFVEPEPAMNEAFGTATSRVDTGWTGAGREAFGNSTSVGLAAPLVSFQGIRHNTDDYLYLSFVVRRDPSFDDRDRVILVLHPNFGLGSQTKTGHERRIDIEPVNSGAGAGTAAPNEPDPWGLTVGSAGFKTGRPARNVEFYRWDAATDSWVGNPQPTGFEVQVRSWDGGVNNRNWSMEVKVPTSIAAGGAGWVDLTTDIGFFFDVVRVVVGTSVGLDFATQFVWPLGGELDDNGGLLDLDEIVIEPSALGRVTLGSGSACTGIRGVNFDGGYGSIGARPVGSGAMPGSAIARTANEFVARVRNDDVTGAAPGVAAEFRIANWGIGPGAFGRWNRIPADPGHTNPSAPANLAAAVQQPDGTITPSTAELTTRWTPGAGEYGTTLSTHQCVWVRLDSSQTVSFVRSSTVRNMDLAPLSRYDQDAEVSGAGWPAGSGDLEFILLTSTIALSSEVERRPDVARLDRTVAAVFASADRGDREDRYLQVFITIVDGYRRTGKTLTINGKTFPVYAYGDSFGYTGAHRSPTLDDLRFVLAGPTVTGIGDGSYRIAVPRDGSARLSTSLRTVTPGGGWLGWLLRLWRAIRQLIRRLTGAGG